MPMYNTFQMCGGTKKSVCFNCCGTGRKNGETCKICHGMGKTACPDCLGKDIRFPNKITRRK